MIGYGVVPVEDSEGYNLQAVPIEGLTKFVSDSDTGRRLSKPSGSRFTTIDRELGFPNFDEEGDRKWYRKDEGVAGLYVDDNRDLYADVNYLAYSNPDGRVPISASEAGARQNLDSLASQIQEARDTKIAEAQRLTSEYLGRLAKL